MKRIVLYSLLIFGLILIFYGYAEGQSPAVPDRLELMRPFGPEDRLAFQKPPLVYHPETWFHYIGGNVSFQGITADLEAIANAGLSGIQLFHGQFGGPWPGVEPQIPCLSEKWDEAVQYTAKECKRLGLRFTMQNCPGWAMSGGPWITPENAMRNLIYSTISVEKGKTKSTELLLPVPQPSKEDWRDYRDIAVLAFPTPLGDEWDRLVPDSVTSSQTNLPWIQCLGKGADGVINLNPSPENSPYWIDASFSNEVTLRSVTLPGVQSFLHAFCYEPGIHLTVIAILSDGTKKTLVDTEMPPSSWQDDQPITFACDETRAKLFRITISNKQNMRLEYIKLSGKARINNWESEAGWTLRRMLRTGNHPNQSSESSIQSKRILDITKNMDVQGHLNWEIPDGKWTILRIGHVNAGRRNAPAPPEGTGWECNKLSKTGPEKHFAGYIGRLAKGPLTGGLLNGLLLDSWECKTQTWTSGLDKTFFDQNKYSLITWLPAVFGYVVDDHETSKRFLRDWRGTLNTLFTNEFYGRMAELARQNGLTIQYETAAGDIVPADILEYYKHADIPMCEFWQPFSRGFVGSLNFKPIKPTVSAARIYGKPRVASEAFTSFELTWDENWNMLKEVFNINAVEGVTHCVFHTCTHNPQVEGLPPGTSMGSKIGTPFIRKQTWWKHLSVFVDYLSRCNYLLERGLPVSDVLWYLGDEIDHKPDQNAPFPEGFKYDYCNPDVLLHRLSVKDACLVTPEGIRYRVLWLPETTRMLPETLKKLESLVRAGAIIVGNRPQGPATLAGGSETQKQFDSSVDSIWGKKGEEQFKRQVGSGFVYANTTIEDVLKSLKITPDVKVVSGPQDINWLHRHVGQTDCYFICTPIGKDFKGSLEFRIDAKVAEIWDPVTGEVQSIKLKKRENKVILDLNLFQYGSCFVMFHKEHGVLADPTVMEYVQCGEQVLSVPWTLTFPKGYGIENPVHLLKLAPWKNLDLSSEGKAFSGSVKYTTSFIWNEINRDSRYLLDLGNVAMIAVVKVNGNLAGTVWTKPYSLDISKMLRKGDNQLEIEVTGTWFNRLVYDAGQPEKSRKTWTICGPDKGNALRDSGLLGPVMIKTENRKFD